LAEFSLEFVEGFRNEPPGDFLGELLLESPGDFLGESLLEKALSQVLSMSL